jgi:L-alanine-DL-glutamate epimerase-like enolase superfamily enzyme
MAELATEWWARGFRSFKVKVGKDLDADLRALEAMHRAAPAATFRPDANAGFSREQALAYANGAQKLGAALECFEQPCGAEDLEGMAAVAEALTIPVIADESVKRVGDLERVLRAKAADGVNLKIAKSGGLLRAREVGALARAHGMPLMVGGMVETRLGMTAATHLAASLGGAEFPDLDTAWLLREDPFEGGYQADGPRYTLPDSPGLGLRPRA